MCLNPNSLYIILFYLRPTPEPKYHWGLLLTGSTPPTGKFYHATDEGRNALDLVRESYPTDSGMLQSRMVVAALYIGQVSEARLEWASQDAVTYLMERRHLPRGEPQWTCRIWVKTVLAKVAEDNQSKTLTEDLARIELAALATADKHRSTMGNAVKYNDDSWLENTTRAIVGSK
ncbi:hypothetical protein F5883DRAFT_651138 [Diaporthe sp. PMI_573]|nr:hypothetical protein F5883DRAFT_651138 [Diaporthaceae sp. PMI_573]